MALTQQQIQQAREEMGIQVKSKPSLVGKYDYLLPKEKEPIQDRIGNFLGKAVGVFTSSTKKFGETIGTALSTKDKQTTETRQSSIDSINSQIDLYMKQARDEKDKERKKSLLEAAQKLAGMNDVDIYNNKEYQKTAKQIIGEGLGTLLEVTAFSAISGVGKAGKAVGTGKQIARATKEGALIGGGYGGAFGTAESMQDNDTLAEIAQSTLIAGAIGAGAGGVLGGGLSAAGKGITGMKSLIEGVSKQTPKAESAIAKFAEKRLYETANDLLKMSPTMTKAETRFGKDTPKLLVDEGILPMLKSEGKNLDATDAINAIRSKASSENEAFTRVLDNSGEYVSIEEFRQQAITNIKKQFKTKGSDSEKAVKYINKEIDSYIKNYADTGIINGDDFLVGIGDFNTIKSGLWNKTAGFGATDSEKLISNVSYQMGQTAKGTIESKLDDIAVIKMNSRLGDLAQAIKVLESANGKKLPGSFFGNQFTKLAGTVAGAADGGIVGGLVGNMTGGALARATLNPEIKISIWSKLYNSLSKTSKGKSIIKEAEEILRKQNETRGLRKLLDTPKTIPLGVKGDTSKLFTQQEAMELYQSMIKQEPTKLLKAPLGDATNPIIANPPLKGKGEILKPTPKKAITEPLTSEAKKFKTADEFVDKQKPKSSEARLYRGSEQKFDKNFDLTKTDAPNGYSTWTDNPELARQYAGKDGYVYKIDLPKNQRGKELINQEGDRVLFLNNEKPAGLNGVKGDEYLLYQDHELYSPDLINEFKTKSQLTDIWKKANKTTKLKSANTLTSEAKKYKSANEFVEGQGETLYHGTNKSFDKIDINKAGEIVSADWGKGIYLTPSKSEALSYAKDATQIKGGKPIVKNFIIDKNAKIKDVYIGSGQQTNQSLGKELLQDGYDGAKIYDGPKGDIDTFHSETIIVNPRILKTKSQLTDIWKKANK